MAVDGARATFPCECETGECEATFPLSPSEWDHVRARPHRFVVAPGHASIEEIEAVIARHERYWIVEKHGEAGEIAGKLA